MPLRRLPVATLRPRYIVYTEKRWGKTPHDRCVVPPWYGIATQNLAQANVRNFDGWMDGNKMRSRWRGKWISKKQLTCYRPGAKP